MASSYLSSPSSDVSCEEDSIRLSPLTVFGGFKRLRSEDCLPIPLGGCETPTLILPHSPKKLRLEEISCDTMSPGQSDLLDMLPDEVLGHVLSFLGSIEDRFALQCTCRLFRRLSNADELLVRMHLGGDPDTGQGGIFSGEDTIDSAISKVSLFARAGNLEALYMLGMIKTYCQPDVEGGILILQRAAAEGFVRAHYILGIILRDSHASEAAVHMKRAAELRYLPALQETMNNRDIKEKFGNHTAEQLRSYIDPICLNRLLGKHYVHSETLRALCTSHCWNPKCGRWAFKGPPAEGSLALLRVSRMKMCSRCSRAKYCSKLCQVYHWRSNGHSMECHYL